MPYSSIALKILRTERNYAVVCSTIARLREEIIEREQQRNTLLERLILLKTMKEEEKIAGV
jgi:hypothetical protein